MTQQMPILSVKNLNLVFRVPIRENHSMRDAFTQFVSSPWEIMSPNYDRLHIAKNMNFDVHAGERIGLLGVNGAGKTSLCRCIAGMYKPTGGTINVNGSVRAIFDTQVGIHPDLTGRENAELLVQFLFPGIKRKKAEEVVEESLEFSELGKFVDAPYKLYSNGMQARLCLSLISARPSPLLILDEVFDGADLFFREKIENRVLEMIRQSGAVIFVSHSMDQLLKVCNRVLLINNSEIIYDGDPKEAIEIYKDVKKIEAH